MIAEVLTLRKRRGIHYDVILLISGSKSVVSINSLKDAIKSGKVTLTNAYVTSNNQVRHKCGTKKFSVVSLDVKTIKPVTSRTKPVDLDKYRNSKVYDGKTRKFGITVNGISYIVKFPKRDGDISTICEHVASSFINNLGYSAHSTKLCLYEGEVVVLMKDFTTDKYHLRSFKDTGQSSEDTDASNKHYSYEDVLYLIDKHTKIDDKFKEESRLRFWRMFVLDAILANRDRHHGNWGYLNSANGYRLAPIYDNGACLFPDVSANIDKYLEDRLGFISERSERYPASLLTVYSEEEKRYKRTNYYKVIGSFSNSELIKVVQEFRCIGVDNIRSAIVSAVSSDLIPDVYKRFFEDIVVARYLHIVCREPLDSVLRRL